jgi:hypothetical protein
MKIKEFFKNTKKALGIKLSDEDTSKIERLKKLLLKLQESKKKIKKELQSPNISNEKKAELEEELVVYKYQIKKGKKILEKKNKNAV